MTNPELRTDVAIGVDGCPAGWVAAIYRPGEGIAFEVVPTIHSLIESHPGVAIGIDIPIGLGDCEPRGCDLAARKLLGAPRASSVFPAPCRGLLGRGMNYQDLSAESRRLTGKGISQQTFHIIPKIEDADNELNPGLQTSVIEVHPELSFWKLAGGRPMHFPKKSSVGYVERRDVLCHPLEGFPAELIPETPRHARSLAPGAGADDVLDAIVAAWSALRYAKGHALIIPDSPERDERGLLMQMVV